MSLLRRIFSRLPRLPSFKKDSDGGKSDSVSLLLEHFLTAQHVLYVSVAFLSWLANTLSCHLVTFNSKRLCAQYGIESLEELRLAITLTETSRPIGAFVFGLLADRFGRRWPLTLSLLGIGGFTLATAFAFNYSLFLAIHTICSFFIGGTYGIIIAIALENLPAYTRGFLSGFLNTGYYVGYLIAGGVDMIVVSQLDDWRFTFYIGSGAALLMAILSAFCPDSECFIRLRREPYLYPDSHRPSAGEMFRASLWSAICAHWKRTIYSIILLTGFHSLSHVTQDLYKPFTTVEKGLSDDETNQLIMIGTAGSIIGALFGGTLSQYLGRRIIMILMCISAAGFVSLWILPNTYTGLALGYFWLRFCLQGAWGALPIYISEISPDGCLAHFVGITYNLGQMISSMTPTLARYAAKLTEFTRDDLSAYQYSLAQTILFSICISWVVFLLFFGHEKHGIELRSIGVLRPIILPGIENS